MKIKIATLLILSLFIGTSFKADDEIKWMDFNKGYELAKKKNNAGRCIHRLVWLVQTNG